jgi:hypothetical protein
VQIPLWLLVGLAAAAPLLAFAHRLPKAVARDLLGIALIVAALIYVGFGWTWGAARWLGIEMVGVAIFGAFVLLARRRSTWWLVIGWSVHAVWDVALHFLGPGRHVAPAWYAIACLSFDLAVAGYLVAVLLAPRRGSDAVG